MLMINLSVAKDTIVDENTYTVNTLSLIMKAAKDMPDCLGYETNQVVLKMEMTPLGPSFYWTLNVSHNSPNFLTMTHPELSKSPYTEFNYLFGWVYEELTSQALSSLVPGAAGDITTGRQQFKDFGDTQSVQTTEATVLGHPGALILQMFGTGGLKLDGYYVGKGDEKYWHQCETHGCIEEKNTNIGKGIRSSKEAKKTTPRQKRKLGGDYMRAFAKGVNSDAIFTMFDVKVVHDVLKDIKPLNTFFQKFGSQFRMAAASVGARVDHVFCKSDIAIFAPYYLSGVDAMSWRGGYPIADPEYSKTILNPLSEDTIGIKSSLSFRPHEKWGNVFPREAAVNIANTAKAAAIIAHRANSILADKKRSGIRIYRKPQDNNVGAWNKIIPPVSTTTDGAAVSACHMNVANTGTFIHNNSTYAYTSWPQYTCDLAGGITIARMPLKIQITQKVPE